MPIDNPSRDNRVNLTNEQRDFIRVLAEENDMDMNQLAQYVVDDFLLQLYRMNYRSRNKTFFTTLSNYVRSPSFKRKRSKFQNAGPR